LAAWSERVVLDDAGEQIVQPAQALGVGGHRRDGVGLGGHGGFGARYGA
jgi:hypothetical protein